MTPGWELHRPQNVGFDSLKSVLSAPHEQREPWALILGFLSLHVRDVPLILVNCSNTAAHDVEGLRLGGHGLFYILHLLLLLLLFRRVHSLFYSITKYNKFLQQ
jgi:hypothetical protein